MTWFAIDSASSLLAGAWANVAMVNLLPLLLVLPLAWRLAPTCDRLPADNDPTQTGPARLALASAIVGVATGLAIAFAMTPPLFDTWWAGLGAAHFDGAPPPSARALVRCFAGPIGGSTAGQFVLSRMRRATRSAGERPAGRAGARSRSSRGRSPTRPGASRQAAPSTCSW